MSDSKTQGDGGAAGATSAHRTPLYQAHRSSGGKMVNFAGWEMPLHYGSQISEHHAVRQQAGMFDVSHMTVLDVQGGGAEALLRRVVANDVARLDGVGRALYGLLLNEAGGVIDDLIVYRRSGGYRVVTNAATRSRVLDWLARCNDGTAEIAERELAMVAVQGPAAVSAFAAVSGWSGVTELEGFCALEREGWMAARTGYTGEDGVEVMLPGAHAPELWEALERAGVKPAGLGARDTLRLEAGLNLYGQDMDETTSPLVSNLGWTIAWKPEDRAFIGREALAAARSAGVTERLTGLVMEQRGVLRHGQTVITSAGEGVITSGIFSPTLGYSIALARVPKTAAGTCEVEIRGRRLPARIVRPPFVRNGRKVFD